MLKKLRKILLVMFFVSAFFLLSSNDWAASLSFVPPASSIQIGDPIDIDIVVSGLDSIYLGAFDLNVNYDDSILGFSSYILGDGLGDISMGEALDWSYGDIGGGQINLAELSLLWDLSFQSSSFTLATLSFSGLSEGTSGLTFSDVILSDEFGSPIDSELSSGSVDVTPIPEPASMLLLSSGLIGFAGFRRKLKKLI